MWHHHQLNGNVVTSPHSRDITTLTWHFCLFLTSSQSRDITTLTWHHHTHVTSPHSRDITTLMWHHHNHVTSPHTRHISTLMWHHHSHVTSPHSCDIVNYSSISSHNSIIYPFHYITWSYNSNEYGSEYGTSSVGIPTMTEHDWESCVWNICRNWDNGTLV